MIKAKLVDTDIRIFELVLALLASLRQKGKGVLVFEDLLRKKAKVSEAIVFGSGNAALLASLVAMKKITKGEKTDVIITPGIGFGENGEGYVRFALTVSKERIQEAVDRMEKII